MTYLEFLKTHDNIEKYVLLLLDRGFSVQETATMVEMTRQGVYDIIKRNKDLIAEYMDSLKGVVDGLTKGGTDENEN